MRVSQSFGSPVADRDVDAPFSMTGHAEAPTIFIVEDNPDVRELLERFLEESGLVVQAFESAEAFLKDYRPGKEACLLLDLTIRGSTSSQQLLARLKTAGQFLPVVLISGSGNLTMAIEAMKFGAADYLQKPIRCGDLLDCLERVFAHSCYRCHYAGTCIGSAARQEDLTARQKQIMALVLVGHPSKNIAADLGISQRTVENHRAAIMRKTGTRTISDLARVSLATRWRGIGDCPPCFSA